MTQSDISLWLHNKLGTSNDSWIFGSIASQLSPETLVKIKHCFQDLQPQVKLKLLLSLFGISRRNLEAWSTQLTAIIDLALYDSEPWVAMVGEILKRYPTTGRLNCDIEMPEANKRIYLDVLSDAKRALKKATLMHNASPKTAKFVGLQQPKKTASGSKIGLRDLAAKSDNENTVEISDWDVSTHQPLIPLETKFLNKNACLALVGQPNDQVVHFALRRKPKAAALKNELLAKCAEVQTKRQSSHGQSGPQGSGGHHPTGQGHHGSASVGASFPVRRSTMPRKTSLMPPPPLGRKQPTKSSNLMMSSSTAASTGVKLLDVSDLPPSQAAIRKLKRTRDEEIQRERRQTQQLQQQQQQQRLKAARQNATVRNMTDVNIKMEVNTNDPNDENEQPDPTDVKRRPRLATNSRIVSKVPATKSAKKTNVGQIKMEQVDTATQSGNQLSTDYGFQGGSATQTGPAEAVATQSPVAVQVQSQPIQISPYGSTIENGVIINQMYTPGQNVVSINSLTANQMGQHQTPTVAAAAAVNALLPQQPLDIGQVSKSVVGASNTRVAIKSSPDKLGTARPILTIPRLGNPTTSDPPSIGLAAQQQQQQQQQLISHLLPQQPLPLVVRDEQQQHGALASSGQSGTVPAGTAGPYNLAHSLTLPMRASDVRSVLSSLRPQQQAQASQQSQQQSIVVPPLQTQQQVSQARQQTAAGPLPTAPAGSSAADGATIASSLTLTREQMMEAQEMFRTANKVTRPEKALILGFMAGSRDNPCPHLGNVVTIKLSEGQEQMVQQDGMNVLMDVETHFQMNYSTGEWKRIKKYRRTAGGQPTGAVAASTIQT